jgi:hypothetical protein
MSFQLVFTLFPPEISSYLTYHLKILVTTAVATGHNFVTCNDFTGYQEQRGEK